MADLGVLADLPFHITNSAASCATECIDQGFIACTDPYETGDKSISSCHYPNEWETVGEDIPARCTSMNTDLVHRYLGCPRETFCGT